MVSVNHLPSPLRQVHYLGSGDPKLTEGLVYTLRLKLRCKYHKGLIIIFQRPLIISEDGEFYRYKLVFCDFVGSEFKCVQNKVSQIQCQCMISSERSKKTEEMVLGLNFLEFSFSNV